MPIVQRIRPNRTQVAPYEVFAAAIDLEADYENPYDFDEISVEILLTGPGAADYHVDAFYRRDLTIDPDSGVIQTGQADGFHFRFTPTETGTWQYTVRVTDTSGTSEPLKGNFVCVGASQSKGFVRRTVGNYLQFDNNELYLPIGENMAWPQGNPYLCYRNWLDELAKSGGNFIRLWHAHWGLGIEWKKDGPSFGGLRDYAAPNLAYLDWLFDHCAELGIRVMLTLQHHGPVSTRVDPNWTDSPYNLTNGGPCRHPWAFFSNAAAKAHTRNRLRYCVARWGHSPALLAWELFNEVDWTDDYATHRDIVTAWQLDMAAFLKEIDPYGHLVTTSYAKAKHEPEVWRSPSIDFTQTHHYHRSDNLERALVDRTRQQLAAYGKPTLNAEFGLGGQLDLAALDPAGIHLHNAIWAGLFGGGLGAAMSWWWDTYVHPQGLFRHFAALRAVSERIPFLTARMQPARVFVIGAPVDLSLVPVLGWSELATRTIQIDASGATLPAAAPLSRYLYGTRWNRRYRCPPTFRVDYPLAGSFTVETGSTTGKKPRLAISIDGVRQVTTRALPEQSYRVAVPPGVHTIKVDNVGKDWVSITAYHFSGLGAALDAYALVAEDKRSAAGWVLNHQYHHRHLAADREPERVVGAELRFPGFQDGAYSVSWFDCQQGTLREQAPVVAREGILAIAVPPVRWDAAFLVEESLSLPA